MDSSKSPRINRRDMLKFGGAALIGAAALPSKTVVDGASCSFMPEESLLTQSPCSGQKVELEYVPTSPFILYPFTDPLPVPEPLEPVPSSVLQAWKAAGIEPSPAVGRQASDGDPSSTHSLWPSDITFPDESSLPEPIVYDIKLQVAEHSFTSSLVRPINALGETVVPPDKVEGPRYLPKSTIFGYNGTFPGPMINARYGRPVVVRFEGQLHKDDPQDFGAPHGEFLTHLHNGHTAPESDGNPHFRPQGYHTGEWVDNLYLNWPPDGDDSEKQCSLWFHDHYHDYTGANVYKGLVGLYPIYDEEFGDDRAHTRSGSLTLDPGDETKGLRLPGRRRYVSQDTFKVDYDIPLVLHDITLDDGVTPHQDFHNGCGETRPDLWGKKFFKHYPDRGFVGDIYTVNGKAFPVYRVKRRRYRFRFLNASIARVYTCVMMKSASNSLVAAAGKQGQWRLPDGQRAMPFTQIASEGGLLPYAIDLNSIELWPSKRKDVVIDFTDHPGSVLYLVNTMKMVDGRKPDGTDSAHRVPLVKFIIEGPPPETDESLPLFTKDAAGNRVARPLRPLPDVDLSDAALAQLPHRHFELERGGGSSEFFDNPVERALAKEYEWLINDRPFQICSPLASPQKNRPEVWHVKNGGGGWIHPMHFHQEEHRIVSKNGVRYTKVTAVGADDVFAKEDTISLGPGEEVVIYRNFRTFPSYAQARVGMTAKYVAHCHNLAHEDHSMMFGWQIVDKITT